MKRISALFERCNQRENGFEGARVAYAVYGGRSGNALPHVAHAVYGGYAMAAAGAGAGVAGAGGAGVAAAAGAGAGAGVAAATSVASAAAAHDAGAVLVDAPASPSPSCQAFSRKPTFSPEPHSFSTIPSKTAEYAATFRRVEKKYCLYQEQYEEFLPVVMQHMQPDAYPQTVVSSLYYDTPENGLISRSLEKPLYKEKLRVRSYGSLQADGSVRPTSNKVFVELKKKYKGVVYKRRLALPVEDAQTFLAEGSFEGLAALPYQERQVAREIAAFLARYEKLRPAMITQCVRTAWKQPGSQLRITFDGRLRAGRPVGDPLAFRMAERPLELLRPDQVLMEIKQAGGMPLWLVEALSACRVYPQSFSKYGTAYEMTCGNACEKASAASFEEARGAVSCGAVSCGAVSVAARRMPSKEIHDGGRKEACHGRSHGETRPGKGREEARHGKGREGACAALREKAPVIHKTTYEKEVLYV